MNVSLTPELETLYRRRSPQAVIRQRVKSFEKPYDCLKIMIELRPFNWKNFVRNWIVG